MNSEYQRGYYKKNKDKIKNYPSRSTLEYKEKLKQCRTNLKIEVVQHYNDGKCAKCGYDDIRALCIDHINSDGNHRHEKSKSGYSLHCWIKKNDFPNDLQVLCANCNLIKQHESKEWGNGRPESKN